MSRIPVGGAVPKGRKEYIKDGIVFGHMGGEKVGDSTILRTKYGDLVTQEDIDDGYATQLGVPIIASHPPEAGDKLKIIGTHENRDLRVAEDDENDPEYQFMKKGNVLQMKVWDIGDFKLDLIINLAERLGSSSALCEQIIIEHEITRPDDLEYYIPSGWIDVAPLPAIGAWGHFSSQLQMEWTRYPPNNEPGPDQTLTSVEYDNDLLRFRVEWVDGCGMRQYQLIESFHIQFKTWRLGNQDLSNWPNYVGPGLWWKWKSSDCHFRPPECEIMSPFTGEPSLYTPYQVEIRLNFAGFVGE